MQNPLQGIQTAPPAFVPKVYLNVTRPSRGADEAVVYSAYVLGSIGGRGEARVWCRQADGTWAETEERVAWWIS